jgi:hypothetical protein
MHRPGIFASWAGRGKDELPGSIGHGDRPATRRPSMETPTKRLMPAAFFGHGSPMNALETNRYTVAWRSFGESVPRPRAILVVSANPHANCWLHARVLDA